MVVDLTILLNGTFTVKTGLVLMDIWVKGEKRRRPFCWDFHRRKVVTQLNLNDAVFVLVRRPETSHGVRRQNHRHPKHSEEHASGGPHQDP